MTLTPEIPEAAVEAAAEQIMRHAAVGELVWSVCTDERQDIFRDAARAALTAALPHMPDRGYAERAGELPDAVRVPLHSLTADIEYLFGRVAADGSCAPAMANSALDRLRQIEAAIRALAKVQP